MANSNFLLCVFLAGGSLHLLTAPNRVDLVGVPVSLGTRVQRTQASSSVTPRSPRTSRDPPLVHSAGRTGEATPPGPSHTALLPLVPGPVTAGFMAHMVTQAVHLGGEPEVQISPTYQS